MKRKASKARAWCPKCERHHIAYIDWIGRGTPRILCESCKYIKAGK